MGVISNRKTGEIKGQYISSTPYSLASKSKRLVILRNYLLSEVFCKETSDETMKMRDFVPVKKNDSFLCLQCPFGTLQTALAQHIPNNMPMHIGEADVAAAEVKGEFFVVYAQEV